jgi:hypothetical protein
MSEITLPCEIVSEADVNEFNHLDDDEELTFSQYIEVKTVVEALLGKDEFSRLMESCGDSEAIEDVFSDEPADGMVPIALAKLMNSLDSPSWETIESGLLYLVRGCHYNPTTECTGLPLNLDDDFQYPPTLHVPEIEKIVAKYDAEYFDLE